jgi:hypothetical protein
MECGTRQINKLHDMWTGVKHTLSQISFSTDDTLRQLNICIGIKGWCALRNHILVNALKCELNCEVFTLKSSTTKKFLSLRLIYMQIRHKLSMHFSLWTIDFSVKFTMLTTVYCPFACHFWPLLYEEKGNFIDVCVIYVDSRVFARGRNNNPTFVLIF